MLRDQEDRAEQVASQMEQLRQSHLQELHTTRSDRAINRSYTPPRSDRAIYRSFTPTGQTEPFTGATHQQVRQSHLQELHTNRSDRAIYRSYTPTGETEPSTGATHHQVRQSHVQEIYLSILHSRALSFSCL